MYMMYIGQFCYPRWGFVICVTLFPSFAFLNSKNVSHDEEVRKLYQEMENQIKLEKERILAEVNNKLMLLIKHIRHVHGG